MVVQSRMGLRKSFAANLRAARLRRRMSQKELADLASVDRSYVGLIEREANSVSLDVLERLAAAMGVTPSSLLRQAALGRRNLSRRRKKGM
jgi:transcriptional regulator with XRE-family HTH domain